MDTLLVVLGKCHQQLYKSTLRAKVNGYEFTRLLPPPKGSGFPPTSAERILFMKTLPMSQKDMETESKKVLMILALSVLYGGITNWFIIPYHLYSGGILGMVQLLRSLITEITGVQPPFDYAGLLYYLVNIPILIIVQRMMGRRYFVKTAICISAQSLSMALIPIPAAPLIDDTLAACLLGGILRGVTIGLCLRFGSNDGGMDLVGIILINKDRKVTVGQLGLIVNIILYVVLAMHYDLTTAVYSMISSAMMSYALDRFYSQGINVEMHIITRENPVKLEQAITSQLRRSATTWQGTGIYAGQPVHILYVVMNKYEVHALRRLVRSLDPGAFIIENAGVKVMGHFEKHLS